MSLAAMTLPLALSSASRSSPACPRSQARAQAPDAPAQAEELAGGLRIQSERARGGGQHQGRAELEVTPLLALGECDLRRVVALLAARIAQVRLESVEAHANLADHGGAHGHDPD